MGGLRRRIPRRVKVTAISEAQSYATSLGGLKPWSTWSRSTFWSLAHCKPMIWRSKDLKLAKMSYHVSQRVEPHTVLGDLTFLALKLRRAIVEVFKPPKGSKRLTIKQKFLQPGFYIGKVNAMIAWRSAMVILLRFYPTSAIVMFQPSFCSLYRNCRAGPTREPFVRTFLQVHS